MIEEYSVYKNLVEKHLADFLFEGENTSLPLMEAMKYSLTAGGKRLRPVLCMAACEFVGGKCRDALPFACAIEYIHTYSLIHDDLPCMDDDDLRRGKPTNHKVFGEGMAVLAGDGLLTTAFEAMSKELMMYFDTPEQFARRACAMYAIAEAAGIRGMVAGQACDLSYEGRQGSEETLNFIDRNKTAALIKASVLAGLYIGGADPQTRKDLELYAEALGLAFQVADDILDVTGSEAELGKPVGSDEEKAKTTSVTVLGLENAKKRLADLTSRAIEAIAPYYDNAEFFRHIAEQLAIRTS